MSRQPRRLSESGIHHVMLRGINRDAIFLEDDDRVQFLRCLSATKELSGCQVLAYCLMPNHVHLVLRTAGEPLSVVLKRLGVRYAGWFNHKYGRVGHLFQDRFRSKPVEDDGYLATVLRYVWNNPVEAGLVERPEDYPWSSRHLLGQRQPLVDEVALRELTDPSALVADAMEPPFPEPGARKAGRPPRHTADEAHLLLCEAARITEPKDFGLLDRARQREVVSQLRTRGVSYQQIGALVGRSAVYVRRLQLSCSEHQRVGDR
jgi:REP element-mobilizing transposase RayT